MTPDPHLTRLARGGFLNLIGALSAGVFGFVLVAVIAHGYPSGVAGAFFAASSVFLILEAACELGSDTGLVRWLPHYLAQQRYSDAHNCLSLAVTPIATVSCLVALIVFGVAPWIARLISSHGASPDRVSMMLQVLALCLPIAAVHYAVLSATRGYGTMRPTVLVEKLGRVPVQVVGVLVAQTMGGSPAMLAVGWSAPYLLGLVAGAVWLAAITREGRGPVDVPAPRPRREVAAQFWRYTGPRALARVSQVALQRADIVMVAALRSPREAALYTVATRFIVVGQLGAQAVQQVMQPTVSRLLTLGDRASAARVFRTATVWIAVLTWPVYAIVAVAAPLYLSVFGMGHMGMGQATVVILALAMLVATASGPVDIMLLMAGRSGLSLLNNTAALVVDIGLNMVLIPHLGATGAAISWAAAIATRNILPLLQVRTLLRMSPASLGVWWATGSVVLCFGPVPLAVRMTAGLQPLALLACLLLCAIAYAGALWLGREHIALSAMTGILRRRGIAGGVVTG